MMESPNALNALLVTHRLGLDVIEAAYDLSANQRDGVIRVAVTP